jgi:ParB family chromosome partitioning protein
MEKINPSRLDDIQQMDLSWIHFEDDTYRITTDEEITGLVCSIRTVGLLSPPIVTPVTRCEKRRFMIVSGFRRIAACHHLGFSHIPVRVVPSNVSLSGDTDEETANVDIKPDCVAIAITDNACQRPLNRIEQARSIALLASCLSSQQEVIKMVSALTGIRVNPDLLKKLRGVARLSSDIQYLLQTDVISLTTALELETFDEEIAKLYIHYFRHLNLSVSNQKEFMMLTREIARRENTSLRDVLTDASLNQILQEPERNRNQKTHDIRMVLKKWRFPALTETENTFTRYVKTLKLEPEVRLVPPKYFEGLEYTLCLTFRNMAELKMRSATVERIVHHPAIHSILS